MNTHLFIRAAAAADGPSPVVPKPAEIIVGLIAFSILFILLKLKAVPMFEKAYAARTSAIQGGMERAEAAQLAAEAALKSYTAQLNDARGEAQVIREEARVQGAAIIEDLRGRAQEEANRITAAARAAIEAERQLATELASKIVGEALDDQVRQSGIVDRFLSELEKSEK